jgi:hypothetical protein
VSEQSSPVLTNETSRAIQQLDAAEPNCGDDATQLRQCGRCRGMFPGDPTLHPTALPEWWLCRLCRDTLFGASSKRRMTG